MFVYKCAGCGAGAKKPPCGERISKTQSVGLGSWQCSGSCKGQVKVKRQKGF
jgi:hypothetical protein